ncbi:hypothetical protein SDC9_61276 [bioreactor metagenome]|uniref:Uncharacterized protein n=1 Tax=bioreactor metagenome TaxID=1076179 RepID=A0A644XFC7_9ZZZZ
MLADQGSVVFDGGLDVGDGSGFYSSEADGGHCLLGHGAVQIGNRNHVLVFKRLGIIQNVFHVLDPLVGDICGSEQLHHLVLGVLDEFACDNLDERGAVPFAVGRLAEPGVVHQVVSAQDLHQRIVIPVVLQDAEKNPLAIRALVGVDDGGDCIFSRFGVLVAILGGNHQRAVVPDGLGKQGNHDLAALAGFGLLVERRADSTA